MVYMIQQRVVIQQFYAAFLICAFLIKFSTWGKVMWAVLSKCSRLDLTQLCVVGASNNMFLLHLVYLWKQPEKKDTSPTDTQSYNTFLFIATPPSIVVSKCQFRNYCRPYQSFRSATTISYSTYEIWKLISLYSESHRLKYPLFFCA